MRVTTTAQDHPDGDHPAIADAWVTATKRDSGYTVLELVLVMLILGLLASVTIFAVSGMRADAAESGCAAEHRRLATATEAFFAEHGSDPIPATGIDHDRYERTLVVAGLVRVPSTSYDIDATGAIDPEGNSPC